MVFLSLHDTLHVSLTLIISMFMLPSLVALRLNVTIPNFVFASQGWPELFRAHQYRRLRRHLPEGALKAPRFVLFLALLPVVLTPFLLALSASFLTYYGGITSSLDSPEMMIAQSGGGARILDRNGKLLYQYLDDEHGYQEWVRLEDVSPWLVQATIAVEDPDFFSNPGVNLRGLARAGFENLAPGQEFMQGTGGSSITQQLAKLLYFTPEERSERTVSRKLREMTIAIELTRDYSKEQILEWYLNELPYGGAFIGIEQASQRYFSIPARDLNLPQAAFLAGLPQSPALYDPIASFPSAKARQGQVLDLMVRHGPITPEVAALAILVDVGLKPSPVPFLAPHFVLYVGDYIKQKFGEDALLHGGLEVRTTLDLDLNQKAQALLEEHLQENEATTDAHNGAVVVIEPSTGQLLAMVGSRDFFRDDIQGQVNNALALNSPGSTLKPFTYVTSFLFGWGPDWPVVDTPIDYIEEDGKVFTPRNPGDGHTRGVISVKKALGNSLNIPPFKTILWLGVDRVATTARAMGITSLDGKLGPALTLGGVDVTLLDLTYGYSVFGNSGVMAGSDTVLSLPEGNRRLDPTCVLEMRDRLGNVLLDNNTPETVEVIRPEYAYMITDILSDDDNRAETFGYDSVLNIPGWRAAAKSGTSEPFEVDADEARLTRPTSDTWSVGYTTDVAVGVWIGNSDNSRMRNMYSTTIAAPLWHDVMLAALDGKTPRDFVRPDGLVEATVCVPSGWRATSGARCPTVTGLFAEDALARQTEATWGGESITSVAAGDLCATCIPEEITDWKRYLAQEYLRNYSTTSQRPTPSPVGQPTVTPQSPVAQPTPQLPPAQPTLQPAPTAVAVKPTPFPDTPHIPQIRPTDPDDRGGTR